MSLKAQLTDNMKTAMKAGDKDRLGVIRLILAALKQKEVDERIELDDPMILSILDKMLKQRKDSITQFEQAKREDLAAIERYEVSIIQTYMPQQMSEAEIGAAIDSAIREANAGSGPQAIGKVMAVLKSKLAGKADMAKVSNLLKAKLSA